MFKKNKWKLIVSSIVILLPILLGVFGKNYLSAWTESPTAGQVLR